MAKSIDLKTVRTKRLMGELERRVSPDRQVLQQARRKATEILGEAEEKRRAYLLEADASRNRIVANERRLKTLVKRLRALEAYRNKKAASMIDLAEFVDRKAIYAYEAHLALLVLLRRAGGILELPADSPELLYNHDERVAVSLSPTEPKRLRIELVKTR